MHKKPTLFIKYDKRVYGKRIKSDSYKKIVLFLFVNLVLIII